MAATRGRVRRITAPSSGCGRAAASVEPGILYKTSSTKRNCHCDGMIVLIVQLDHCGSLARPRAGGGITIVKGCGRPANLVAICSMARGRQALVLARTYGCDRAYATWLLQVEGQWKRRPTT